MQSAITFEQLISVIVKAFYTKNLDPEIKDFILFAAHKNGLVDEQGKTTPKYLCVWMREKPSRSWTVCNPSLPP
jgi:hypothetical protein